MGHDDIWGGHRANTRPQPRPVDLAFTTLGDSSPPSPRLGNIYTREMACPQLRPQQSHQPRRLGYHSFTRNRLRRARSAGRWILPPLLFTDRHRHRHPIATLLHPSRHQTTTQSRSHNRRRATTPHPPYGMASELASRPETHTVLFAVHLPTATPQSLAISLGW